MKMTNVTITININDIYIRKSISRNTTIKHPSDDTIRFT
ncbi:hypothetical protein JOE25_000575 [Serratia sp. PL17]|nr:hypothetical protein [Serratia sp. PL17]